MVVGRKLRHIQIKREVLLAQRIPQELAEQQPQGRVLQDMGETGIVRVTLHDSRVGLRRSRLLPGYPATHTLPVLSDLVDGVLCRLEQACTGLLLDIRLVLEQTAHQALLDKLLDDGDALAAVDGRTAVHEPVHGGFSSETVLEGLVAHLALLGHLDADNAVGVLADGVGIRAGHAGLEVRALDAGKATEDDLDGGTVVRDLVGSGVAFEDDELHGVAWGVEHVHDVTGRYAIALAETLEDVDTLGSHLVESTFERELARDATVDRLNEAGVDEALADGASHLLGHGESGGRGGGDDAGRILGVRHAVRLRELERTQVHDGLLGGKRVFELGEPHAMGLQLQTDHQGREEVLEVACVRPVVCGHPQEARGGLVHLRGGHESGGALNGVSSVGGRLLQRLIERVGRRQAVR